ncbi:MAG: NAD(P)-dependent alcohol dehydrogenase, partial [Acidimicrobiia bacterium]|nr:NAD(P)-dependent alcohol dehydrogenase [Acidimicrobiia bacterium]
MQAIVQDRYGSADVLELSTIERPEIKPDEVLVEVVAAGLDRGVEHLMTGLPYMVRIAGYGLTKPKTRVPGLDVAGRVVAVGSEVTSFAPGDEVFGIASGSFAQFAAAKETKLAHKPANLTFEQAGVAAISGITALQALTTVGKLQPGQKVLVIGASGGVGSYAVQLAKALGGAVTGVAGSRNLELVRSLGAEQVIDYTAEDFTDGGERYDLIIDTGGRNSIRRLRSVLAPTGALVIVGGEGGGRWTGGIGRQLR